MKDYVGREIALNDRVVVIHSYSGSFFQSAIVVGFTPQNLRVMTMGPVPGASPGSTRRAASFRANDPRFADPARYTSLISPEKVVIVTDIIGFDEEDLGDENKENSDDESKE